MIIEISKFCSSYDKTLRCTRTPGVRMLHVGVSWTTSDEVLYTNFIVQGSSRGFMGCLGYTEVKAGLMECK